MSIKLPVGTIGIRGTIASFLAEAARTVILLEGPGSDANNDAREGRVEVTSGGKTSSIFRPGWAVSIEGPGQPPSDPFEATPDILASFRTALNTVPAKSDEGSDPGRKSNQDKDSDQDAAKATGDLKDTLTIAKLDENLQEKEEDESHDEGNGEGQESQIGSGPSTWDAIRAFYTSGSASFSGTASNAWTFLGDIGGSGEHVHTGSIANAVTIDFSSQLLSGGVDLDCTSCPGSNHDINSSFSVNWSSLSGPAKLAPNFSISFCDNGANCDLSGTTVTIGQVPGDPVHNLTIDVKMTHDDTGSGAGEKAGCPPAGCGSATFPKL